LGVVIGIVAAGYGQNRDLGAQAAHGGGGGYLIRNASLVLTMDPTLGDGGLLGPLENADVLLAADRIAAVGAHLTSPDGAHIIDGRGLIIMPGFVDTHDHLWQSLIRGCAADDDLVG
jgi:5-methylthioadenosine/S-adenosylhomocysteine deaminase